MSAPQTTVLVVEDEPSIRATLAEVLTAEGLVVSLADSGEEAVESVSRRQPDVVLLDLGLPGMDGFAALSQLRRFSDALVVILSARHDRADKIAALDAGADDYVTKPFDAEELLARIRALLRRRPRPTSTRIVAGDVTVDLQRSEVRKAGRLVSLTATELHLLSELVRQPGVLLPHGHLLRRVWGRKYDAESHYLRVYVGQLRRKLGDDATSPRLIRTEPGLGYRWIGGE